MESNPYKAPEAFLEDPSLKSIYTPAGFWIRFAATIIDSLLIMMVTYPLLFLVYGFEYFDFTRTDLIAGPADLFLSWILPIFIVILFWVYKSATPGKMMLSLKIIDIKTGENPTVLQFIGRYFSYFLSMIPLGLGYIWAGFDEKKQAWHDKLAGTQVVELKQLVQRK